MRALDQLTDAERLQILAEVRDLILKLSELLVVLLPAQKPAEEPGEKPRRKR